MNALYRSDDGSDRQAALSTPVTPDPLGAPAPAWPVITVAEEILPAGAAETDYDLWCDTRAQGLGGSDIAAVLGLNPWHSPYHVWMDKVGKGRPIEDTFVMRRGRYYEPALAQWWSDENGIATRRTGTWARTGDEAWKRCNPDRLTADGLGLEIKTPASVWSAQWSVDMPAYYALVQGLWSAHVLGLPGWYLAADVEQNQGTAALPCWYLDVNEWAEKLAYWVEIAEWWWHTYVVGDKPPPVDGSEATAEALNWAYRTPVNLGHMVRVPGLRLKVAERARLKAVEKQAGEDLREVENWIKAALEHDETGCDEDDVPIIAWRPHGVNPDDPGQWKTRAMREIKPPKPKAPRKPRAAKALESTP